MNCSCSACRISITCVNKITTTFDSRGKGCGLSEKFNEELSKVSTFKGVAIKSYGNKD